MPFSSRKLKLRLPGGEISALSGDGLIYARGIRYAQAVRFQKSELVTSWTGVQDCTGPAPLCPQTPSPMSPVMTDIEANRVQDEDCLRVSVVAPESAKEAPVIVFLHGGAYLTGGGDLEAYKPSGFARRGVVAVNITYRLGLLGYVPIHGVAPANLGLLDQIQALKWVQQNVEAFGGDPTNVTVAGQSAGADSIICLLVANDAHNLFHRAILQSGPIGRLYEDSDRAATAMAKYTGRVLSGKNPQTVPIASLLELQTELINVGRSAAPCLLQYAPIFGEYPLPPREQVPQLFAAAAQEKPILIGHTANEDTAFTFTGLPHNQEYLLDMFDGAMDRLIDEVAKETGKRLPSYVMACHPEGSALKACHCIDLSLLLGDFSVWKDALMLQGPESQQMVGTVGNNMKNLWVAFAEGYDLKSQRIIIDADFQFPLKA